MRVNIHSLSVPRIQLWNWTASRHHTRLGLIIVCEQPYPRWWCYHLAFFGLKPLRHGCPCGTPFVGWFFQANLPPPYFPCNLIVNLPTRTVFGIGIVVH